ncbi:MAG: PsbP-related protein [Flavobacteriales bacterium]
MKKLIAFIAISVFVIGCGDSESSSTIHNDTSIENQENSYNRLNKNVYQSDSLGIKFNYPENWNVAEGTFIGILNVESPKSSETDFQEIVSIVVGGTSDKGLDEFFDDNLAFIQGMFVDLDQTEEPENIVINSNTFKKVRYNYLADGFPLTAQLFVTIKEGNSYIINCSALQNTFDTYAEEFTSIVNSIIIQ